MNISSSYTIAIVQFQLITDQVARKKTNHKSDVIYGGWIDPTRHEQAENLLLTNGRQSYAFMHENTNGHARNEPEVGAWPEQLPAWFIPRSDFTALLRPWRQWRRLMVRFPVGGRPV